MGIAISCLGLLLVAARAAGTVTAEKERDSWTTLISTPLSPAEIILGKLAGNLYATRGWVMLLCFLWTLAVVLQPEYLLVVPFVAGTLAILAVFASALGILFSLLCANSLRAMGATLAVALVLGGGYLFCCFPMFFVGGGDPEVILLMAPCVPFLLAAPHFLAMELIYQYPGNPELGFLIAAYVLGMLLYSFAAAGLLTYSIDGFDRLTGRTRREHPLAGPPRPIARTATPGIKNVSPLPPTTEPRRCDPTGD
jgi:ABC-type Na+ efflux pump permease subunit